MEIPEVKEYKPRKYTKSYLNIQILIKIYKKYPIS